MEEKDTVTKKKGILSKTKGVLNLPNMLTILRVLLVPVFVISMLYIESPLVCGLTAIIVFIITSATDFFDGSIARKYNLITTFGKFLDPVADKFMVFSAFLVMAARIEPMRSMLVWTAAIIFFRELGVTSLRMICVNTDGGVISASLFGKWKTVTQIVAVCVVLFEYALIEGRVFDSMWIASYILLAGTIFMTVASGIDYLKSYWPYIDTNK